MKYVLSALPGKASNPSRINVSAWFRKPLQESCTILKVHPPPVPAGVRAVVTAHRVSSRVLDLSKGEGRPSAAILEIGSRGERRICRTRPQCSWFARPEITALAPLQFQGLLGFAACSCMDLGKRQMGHLSPLSWLSVPDPESIPSKVCMEANLENP
ncbi:Doublecortin domain-containing protein 2 [Manis javanica]|nr:Doublecortin domain-containing protein 2 [Manis javanica]